MKDVKAVFQQHLENYIISECLQKDFILVSEMFEVQAKTNGKG